MVYQFDSSATSRLSAVSKQMCFNFSPQNLSILELTLVVGVRCSGLLQFKSNAQKYDDFGSRRRIVTLCEEILQLARGYG